MGLCDEGFSAAYTVKYPYIHEYFCGEFSIFCSVGPGFIIPFIYGYNCKYGTGFVKCGKLATKYMWIYGYFLQHSGQ